MKRLSVRLLVALLALATGVVDSSPVHFNQEVPNRDGQTTDPKRITDDYTTKAGQIFAAHTVLYYHVRKAVNASYPADLSRYLYALQQTPDLDPRVNTSLQHMVQQRNEVSHQNYAVARYDKDVKTLCHVAHFLKGLRLPNSATVVYETEQTLFFGKKGCGSKDHHIPTSSMKKGPAEQNVPKKSWLNRNSQPPAPEMPQDYLNKSGKIFKALHLVYPFLVEYVSRHDKTGKNTAAKPDLLDLLKNLSSPSWPHKNCTKQFSNLLDVRNELLHQNYAVDKFQDDANDLCVVALFMANSTNPTWKKDKDQLVKKVNATLDGNCKWEKYGQKGARIAIERGDISDAQPVDDKGAEGKRRPSSSRQSRTYASVVKKNESPTESRRSNGASPIAARDQDPSARTKKESKKIQFGSHKADGPFTQKHGKASATGGAGSKDPTDSGGSNRPSPNAPSIKQPFAWSHFGAKTAATTKVDSPVKQQNGRISASSSGGSKRLSETAGNIKVDGKQSSGSSGKNRKSASKGKKTPNGFRGTRSVVPRLRGSDIPMATRMAVSSGAT